MFARSMFSVVFCAMGVVFTIAGCGQGSKPASEPVVQVDAAAPTKLSAASNATPAASTSNAAADEHAHKAGQHGGIIVAIGANSYHAEAVFEKGRTLRLLTLGADEAKVQDVETQTLTAYVKPLGGSEAVAVELLSQPQPGDAEGKTSQFVGQLPESLEGQAVEVTIPSIRIGGERFRLGFASAAASHGDDIMPDKVANEEEKQLYLTAGGRYTEEDIKANGAVTASQKFKGFMSSHDMKPKPGDKICPVTMTKANEKCTWVVGGKTYEFCCPPCVDEFVKLAKENPDDIKDPENYVKRR